MIGYLVICLSSINWLYFISRPSKYYSLTFVFVKECNLILFDITIFLIILGFVNFVNCETSLFIQGVSVFIMIILEITYTLNFKQKKLIQRITILLHKEGTGC